MRWIRNVIKKAFKRLMTVSFFVDNNYKHTYLHLFADKKNRDSHKKVTFLTFSANPD